MNAAPRSFESHRQFIADGGFGQCSFAGISASRKIRDARCLASRRRGDCWSSNHYATGGFALASWHWASLVVLAAWSTFFLRNMRRKDESRFRHPAFAAYKGRTGMFLLRSVSAKRP
jgi:hypothetical protein